MRICAAARAMRRGRAPSRTARNPRRFPTVRRAWPSSSPTCRYGCPTCRRLTQPAIALLFKLQCQLLAAGLYDLAVDQDMDNVRDDVVEQSLIMRDDQEAPLRTAHFVHAAGDDFERVDVEARVGLVEHSQSRL